jgi:hypothetical protein
MSEIQLRCVAQQLKSIEVQRRNQIWVIDYMGPFKISRHGNKYIILGCDAQDKWLEGCATPTFDASTTASFTFNNIIFRYGMIEKILTDQGVSFENALFKDLCRLVGTNKLHSSTYHAMGHGQKERVNKVVKPNLAKFVNDTEDDWDVYLQMTISSYNHSYHASIGMSPFEARFGYKPTLVADVIMKNKTVNEDKNLNSFASGMTKMADHINNVLNSNKQDAQQRQKFYYDRVLHANAFFKIGDLVKITNFRVRPGHSKAFEPKFLGPYSIIQRNNEFNYLLRANNVKDELVHYNRMSHYYAREPECEKPDQLNISTNKRQFAVQKHNAPKTTDERNLFLYASSIARANKKRVEMCRIHQVADANAARDSRAENRANLNIVPRTIIQPETVVQGDAAYSHPPGEGINNDVVDNQHLDSFDEDEPILPSDNQLESFHSFRQAHEEENRSHNEALEDSPTVNNEILPFNANGKEQVLCPHCLPIKKLCEKATGLRTHIRHCHPNVMATNGLLSTPLQVRNDNQAKQLIRPEASSTREGEGL